MQYVAKSFAVARLEDIDLKISATAKFTVYLRFLKLC